MGSDSPGADGQRRGSNSSLDDDPPSTTQIREAQLTAPLSALEAYHAERGARALHQKMCSHTGWHIVARCDSCGHEVFGEAAERVIYGTD